MNTSQNNDRESNIELFRIVATFMIIVVHCNGWFLKLEGINSWYDGGIDRAITRTFIQSVTCIGVDCFILISGYFGIRPKLSSLFNLYTLLVFFYLGGYLATCLLGNDTLLLRGVIYNLLAFSRENWFIQCYLFLLLLSPLLNKFTESISSKGLLYYIGAFTCSAFYFGCYKDSTYFYFNQGYSITTFMLIYLIGRCLRLAGAKWFKSFSIYLLSITWFTITIVIMMVRLLEPSREDAYLSYCSPLLLASSVILFLMFLRIHIRSKIINYIASSCLAVFILHTSSPIMNLLKYKNFTYFTEYELFGWLLRMIIACIIVFFIAISLDKIRLFICSPLIKSIKKWEQTHSLQLPL